VTDTVGRFGGFVAKYMGDGALIYFGYPEAHEDDAERAARAGLGVIDAVGRLATREPLNVRIDIASVHVVGDLIGAGAALYRGIDQGDGRGWRRSWPCFDIRCAGVAVPATLHASLLGRLDRLGSGGQERGTGRRCHRTRLFP
jgi:hypothetical protein